MFSRKWGYWFTIVILLIWLPPAAYAHKIKLFATAQGNVINGYAYFVGGEKISFNQVEVWNPQGVLLGKTMTDAQGQFSYSVTQQIAHTFTVDVGEGHLASYTVPASELMAVIPSQTIEINNEQLASLLEKTVSKHIRPLREQLEAYEEKVRWHDVLGGIGYIFGIIGLLSYFQKSPRE